MCGAEAAVDRGGRMGRGARLYDGLALLLLAWPAVGCMWLLGSTRVWGYAPGLVLSLAGSALVLLRPAWFRGTPRWRTPYGFWPFALLCAYVVASMRWAIVPYAARWEVLRWICLLAAGWSWLQMGARAHRWKWLLGMLLMAAALESLYALVQEVNGSRMVLWTERPEQYGLRASGTYLCPNHFADVLALLAPLAVALVFLPEAGFPLRLMAIYFLAVSAPALYWTQSRSGWLGLAGGLAVTALLLARRASRARVLLVAAVLPLLAAAAGWSAWHALPAVRERFGAVFDDPEKSGGIRMQMWRDMPEMILDRPVWGYGAGSFVWAYPPYQKNVRQHLTWDFLHNEYLQMLVEYGAVGLGLLLVALAWLGFATAGAIRRARERTGAVLLAGAAGGLASALVHACFDFNFHVFPNPHALVWLGGVAWGVWYAQEQGVEPMPDPRRRYRLVAGIVAALACAGCAWLALAGGMSYVWFVRGELARARMDWTAAYAAYRTSRDWDAGNWQPYLAAGHVRSAQAVWYRDPDRAAEQAGKQRLAAEAVGFYRRAGELNSADLAVLQGLARAHNAMGDPEGALEYLRRAVAYQPRHVFYREQLGIQLRHLGRDAEALEVFRKNVADGVASEVSRLSVRTLERKLARSVAAGAAPP